MRPMKSMPGHMYSSLLPKKLSYWGQKKTFQFQKPGEFDRILQPMFQSLFQNITSKNIHFTKSWREKRNRESDNLYHVSCLSHWNGYCETWWKRGRAGEIVRCMTSKGGSTLLSRDKVGPSLDGSDKVPTLQGLVVPAQARFPFTSLHLSPFPAWGQPRPLQLQLHKLIGMILEISSGDISTRTPGDVMRFFVFCLFVINVSCPKVNWCCRSNLQRLLWQCGVGMGENKK